MIGAAQSERINYAREMEKIIALQQAVSYVRNGLQWLEFRATDCVIGKEIEKDHNGKKDMLPYELWCKKQNGEVLLG